MKPEANKVEIYIPKDEVKGYVNNQKESFEFEFDGVKGMDAKQEEIFDGVAKDVPLHNLSIILRSSILPWKAITAQFSPTVKLVLVRPLQ
jgi:hypothetical protein